MTTEEKTSRSVENPYATTNKKPSPSAFVIWLIATIVLLGSAIGLAIPAGIQVSYYIDDMKLTDQLKQEIDDPCKEFDALINACKSGEYDSFDDLEAYWDKLTNALRSRGLSLYLLDMENYSGYAYDIYVVSRLAEEVGFCTQEYIDGRNTYVIHIDRTEQFEDALLSKFDNAYQERLYYMHDSRNAAIAFSIPSIACLIVGIVGIFITIKQHKKIKEGRVAYENAVLAHAVAEEKQKSDMLLIMEAMQRKIDALEGKTSAESIPQNATQISQQQIETPIGATSAQQPTTATPSTNTSAYTDSDATTDTQIEFNQDAPTDSQSENQESASPQGESARPDQLTIGKVPKNPIKYLKFLVKTPIKTMADVKQMKKNIRPLLYTSIGVLAAPMIVVAITGLPIFTSISFIGLVGLGFCGFLHFILKKAQEKFEVLMCNSCHTMIATETTKAFQELVSYEIQNEPSVVTVHHPESQNGIVSNVKASGVVGADVLITMKCPNCGKTKTFVYSITPFRCEKILKNVSVAELGTVKLSLEKAVRAVLDLYMDREKRKDVPYTIHSVNHPNYENRGKAQLNVSRIYQDVQITYHRDIEEMVEGFFVHNELNGKIVNKK